MARPVRPKRRVGIRVEVVMRGRIEKRIHEGKRMKAPGGRNLMIMNLVALKFPGIGIAAKHHDFLVLRGDNTLAMGEP